MLSDVEEPSELIERIRQLYITREGRLSPFPWCEQFNFSLNDIFTKPTIVTRDKTGRAKAAEQISSISGVFKPHKECSKPRTVLIEGEPGIGKTTYCQKLAYDWANGQETDASFPTIKLLLLLKGRDMSSDIWEAVDDQLLPKDIEEEAKEKFFKYIRANQSQVLLVLDGLDEAPSNLTKMFSDLVESRELPKCPIILTSRHEGGVNVSKYCNTLLQIVGFAKENSRSFIVRYFKGREALGQKLLSEIERKKELIELTTHPLTIALLCLLGEDCQGDLPSSKTQLYLEITICVIRRFRRKKGLPAISKNLIDVYKDNLELLGELALKGLREDQIYFEENEIGGQAGEIPVFEFLSVHTGSSKRSPRLCYAFLHKSFQDFFAGFFLSSQISNGKISIEKLLPKDKFTSKFELALFFAFGIINLKSEEDSFCLIKAIIKNINHASDFPINASNFLIFALKCIRECSAVNVRLGGQMLHSLGTELKIQQLSVSSSTCDIPFLAETLKVNTTVTALHIPIYFLKDVCAVSLGRTLYDNQTLSEISIPSTRTSAFGVQQLVDALMVNSSVQRLDLSFNVLQDNGARILAKYLKANKALVALNVSVNGIADPGALSLAESLRHNTTLEVLHLAGNPSIGNPGALSLCETLKINKTLTSLNLSGNSIDDIGIESLSLVLKDNTTLTSLGLSDLKITAKSIRSIAEMLRLNSTLNFLEFQGNKVSFGGARLIAESLKVNTNLKYLNLSRNNLRAPGAHLLSEALKVNTTLAFLGLSQNALKARGAQLLSDGLGVNTTLTVLDLSVNGIGPSGTQSITEALKVNTGLISLNLSTNAIGDSGAQSLCQALKGNSTLVNLDMSDNGIQSSGARAFAEVRKTNNTLISVNFINNGIGDSGVRALVEVGFQRFLPPSIVCKLEFTLEPVNMTT